MRDQRGKSRAVSGSQSERFPDGRTVLCRQHSQPSPIHLSCQKAVRRFFFIFSYIAYFCSFSLFSFINDKSFSSGIHVRIAYPNPSSCPESFYPPLSALASQTGVFRGAGLSSLEKRAPVKMPAWEAISTPAMQANSS